MFKNSHQSVKDLPMQKSEPKVVDLVMLKTIFRMDAYPSIESMIFQSSIVKGKESQRQFELHEGKIIKKSRLCIPISENRFYPDHVVYCRPGDEEKASAALIQAISAHADKMIRRFEHLKLQTECVPTIMTRQEYDRKFPEIELEL